jgi:starch synthase
MSGRISVWHVAREYAGIAEAGGVKDVVRGLAEAYARAGGGTSVVLPFYGFLREATPWGDTLRGDTVASFSLMLPDQDRGNAFFEEGVRIIAVHRDGVRLLFVDSPRFSRIRGVYTYTTEDERENKWRKKGSGHWDFHQLNLILQRSALEAALILDDPPRVFHCHDGHTAFLPSLLREDPRYAERLSGTASLVTIHNAGPGYHQDVWSMDFARLLTGLPAASLEKGALNGTVDPLLLAGFYARLVTVSPQYARELLAEKGTELSGGLGRMFRERSVPLEGITNGIDPGPWDPRHPEMTGLPFRFDPSTGDLEGKRRCRTLMLERLGIPAAAGPSGPLYAFVGRLAGQKGIDILYDSLRDLTRRGRGCMFVVLGQGEKDIEAMLAALAAEPVMADRFVFVPRYDPSLASLIYAASDFFLIPSAYEPCGLTDFIAQLFGSIPVVHRVGGLLKVRDGETGFCYDEQSVRALTAAVDRTTLLFEEEPQTLDRIRRTAFREVLTLHTWDRVLADSYLPLYESLAAERSWTQR